MNTCESRFPCLSWPGLPNGYVTGGSATTKAQAGPSFLFRYTPDMITLIDAPTIIKAAGNKPKRIEEFVGRVNTGHEAVSVARMVSPAGWIEPGQAPEFDEFTVVLRGTLRVESRGATLDVRAGQAVHVPAGDWVRYSTPDADGAEYVAVCLPAFSPQNVHRDPS